MKLIIEKYMKKLVLLQIASYLSLLSFSQLKVKWISTTQELQWQRQKGLPITSHVVDADVEVQLNHPLQTVDGFGTCFNELGWTSLSLLSNNDRENIMRELFAPGVGANFTICRMPLGANDFSRDWYSYNENEGDFAMERFSITNDMKTLVPFIKNAKKYNPALQLWASPWSPPAWMKYNKHYAAATGSKGSLAENGLKPSQAGKEGTNMFIQEDQYFKAYALYFKKFIESYLKQGIRIGMVMPQNEFNSAQVFPSCTWTAAGLAKFIKYLGPPMQNLGVDLFLGTMERPNEKLVDSVLKDAGAGKYIKGVGFQWAGKGAIAAVHKEYPQLKLYQSEQECGDGKNDWKYCIYTWNLIKYYFTNGAKAYMYWNTSLSQGGVSRWGWQQNSLVSIDTNSRTYKLNYEYYLLKHLSHFVLPGAQLLSTTGEFNNLLAFRNTDKSIVIIAQNDSNHDKMINIKVANKIIKPTLKANSFNTFLIDK